jgi:two-component system sensor kinase FixL
MIGYSREELLKMSVSDIEIVEIPDETRKHIQKIFEAGSDRFESQHRCKGGRLIDVEISLTFMRQSSHILVFLRDITARKQAEEEIFRLNAELEERVQQRTAELQAINKELQSFAYIVSHDLKAPLRGISQLADWLVTDYAAAFDEQGREMVRLLIGRVKRMDNLIEGVLQYSRIGRVVGEQVTIDLNTLVQEVIDTLAPPAHVHIEVTDSLPIIVGDCTRIQQLFQNLIGNAIKFLDKPAGQVTIGCRADQTHWTFSVADNGPGIDPKYHAKIFQIFQTLTPRDERESTGIGLAIVKKIVEELYQGKVWVASEVGKGSTFFFTLPR